MAINTKLLATFDAPDLTNPYTDETGIQWQFEGSAKIVGNALIVGAPSDDAVSGTGLNDFADVAFPLFTAECEFELVNTPAAVSMQSFDLAGNLMTVNLADANAVIRDKLNNVALFLNAGITVTPSVKHHIALVRTGMLFALFYDGNLVAMGVTTEDLPGFNSLAFKASVVQDVKIHWVRVSNTNRYNGKKYTVPSQPSIVD